MSDFDSSEAVFKSRAQKLASLMATGVEESRLWRPDELAAIFRHQMAAPVMVDLGTFDAQAASRLTATASAQGLLLKSFADLFQHPAPPIELLTLIKDFAKANRDHAGSPLPAEIATALYYASIAAALVHLGIRISQLPDPSLQSGFRWTMDQSWLDTATRELMGAALDKLRPDNAPGKGSAP